MLGVKIIVQPDAKVFVSRHWLCLCICDSPNECIQRFRPSSHGERLPLSFVWLWRQLLLVWCPCTRHWMSVLFLFTVSEGGGRASFLFIFLCSTTCFQNFKPSHSVPRLTAHSLPFCRFLALLVSDGSVLPFMCSSSLFFPPLLPRLRTSFSSPVRPPSWWDVAVSNCRLAIRG